jgi:hypothetical protein
VRQDRARRTLTRQASVAPEDQTVASGDVVAGGIASAMLLDGGGTAIGSCGRISTSRARLASQTITDEAVVPAVAAKAHAPCARPPHPLEENPGLSGYKNDDFGDRLAAAAAARRATLERFRAQPGPDDPAVAERRAAQAATGLAREARLAERRAARAAEERRRAAEATARMAEQAARDAEEVARAAEDAARKSAADAEAKARSLALAAEQKAVRDARYAARKARQRR